MKNTSRERKEQQSSSVSGDRNGRFSGEDGKDGSLKPDTKEGYNKENAGGRGLGRKKGGKEQNKQ